MSELGGDLIAATLNAGTPLALAALGLLVNERAGIVNLGAEGMMLVAAIAGFATGVHTGSDTLAFLAGAGAGIVMAACFGAMVIWLNTNQYATGLALSLFGVGFSAFVGVQATKEKLGPRPTFKLPWLGDIPLVGTGLFRSHPLVYVAVALTLGLGWFFHRSRRGLVLRAIGESPESAHALGYPVRRIRLLAVMAGGALCGLAGAYLSVVYTPLWVEGMVAGRGWIALALTTFATWRPGRVLLGAYLFGGVTMLQFYLQGQGVEIASQWLTMLPYLATIVVLVLMSRKPGFIRINMPASIGKPFFPRFMSDATRAFVGLVDLAARELGGMALGANDEFFAAAENLLLPGRAVFDPDRYTERGKWMDGWETRRKRTAGHDSCIIELGVAGRVYGFDIDTEHFRGNHPPYASVEGLRAKSHTPYAELLGMPWRTLLPQAPIGPSCQNVFGAEPGPAVSHVRLNMYPDGGIARFRVYGKVEPGAAAPELDELSRSHVPAGLVDLAALKNGADTLACSDARFGHMNSLLLPGRARVMGEGWETRRGRPPDHRHDWLIIALAERGTLELLEVNTNHYNGNYPERFSLEGIDAPGARTTDLLVATDFRPLVPPTPLAAHTRHFFRSELLPHAALTHVRLNIFPDGGISRLRLWGRPSNGA